MKESDIFQKMLDTSPDPFWVRVWRRYHAAQNARAAKEAGIIGVGLITFAEHRVDVFLRRCAR